MHGIHAVLRASGTKDPSSREAPRVFSFALNFDSLPPP
jgi:hypothetical protein